MNRKWLHAVIDSLEVCRENFKSCPRSFFVAGWWQYVAIISVHLCAFRGFNTWHHGRFSLTPSGIWLPNSNVIIVHQFFKHTQGDKVKALKCNKWVLTSGARCFLPVLDCILSATGSAHSGLYRTFVQLLFMRVTVCRFSLLILSQEAPAGVLVVHNICC